MKYAILLGAILATLTSCSTNERLLAPDYAAWMLSPEKPESLDRGRDPICGFDMNEISDFWHLTYQGTTYYFDSLECRRQFEENPEVYGNWTR